MRRPQSPRTPPRPRKSGAQRAQPRPSAQPSPEPEEVAKARTREARVQYIFELMVDGRFMWGAPTELAALWSVTPATARDYAAEAARMFRREVAKGGDEFKTRILLHLESIGRSAIERTEEIVDAAGTVHTVHRPDHRTARQCVMDLAQLGGLLVHRHELAVTELSDEELRAQLRAHGLEVVEVATPASRGEKH